MKALLYMTWLSSMRIWRGGDLWDCWFYREEKIILEISWSTQGIEPKSPGWNARVLTTTPTEHSLLKKVVIYIFITL